MYEWHWNIIWIHKVALLRGAWVTIELCALVLLAGTLLGLLLALLRGTKHPLISFPAVAIIELFRQIPLLVVLIWLYYVLPSVNVVMSGFLVAFIGLSLNLAAYIAETIRAGIESIPKGQAESAITLGYSKMMTMRKIILPQVFQRILPNLMNLYINQIKLSSLASVIAVNEILHMGTIIISQTYRPLEVYTIVAIMYLLIIMPFVGISYLIEKKLSFERKST
ncbi:MAG: amino acid ABC transporter permease [Parcubacteria group bacterium]|jgi:polar amino acid transport system permease protein